MPYRTCKKHLVPVTFAHICCPYCEIEKLRAELSDWRESQKRVMSEECPSDEKHCTCVPMLRREIDRLKETLKEISKGKGAFNRDPLTHAANCVADMKALALAALEEIP